MNQSNSKPNEMQKNCSESRTDTYAYIVDKNIYINLTNRCTNDCTFCIRKNGDGAYGSNSLWLSNEPNAFDVLDAIDELFFENCQSFVFCGYGEPMLRFNEIIQISLILKNRYGLPIRINTNGQALLWLNNTEMEKMHDVIDCVSISLNAPNSDSYNNICRPANSNAFSSILEFAELCKHHVPSVVFTVVEDFLDKYELAMCQAIADRMTIPLRIRKYISK